MLQLHPDVNPNDSAKHDKFVRLNEAYSVLSKPLTRHEYDRKIASSGPSQSYQHGSGQYTGFREGPAPGSPYGGANPFSENSPPPGGFPGAGPRRPFNPE